MSVFRGIIGSLSINLDANIAKFESDLQRAERSVKRQVGQINREIRSMEAVADRATAQIGKLSAQIGAISAAGLALAVRELSNMTSQAKGIRDLGVRLDLSAEAIQELGYAAEQSGISVEKFSNMLFRMGRRVANAGTESGPALRAMRELGIEAEHLASLPIDQQFEALADAINSVGSATLANQYAFEIFGDDARDFIPLIREGSEGLREYREQMRMTGAVMSQETVDAADRLSSAITLLQTQLRSMRVALFSDVIQPLADLAEYLATTERGMERVDAVMQTAMKSVVALGAILAGRFVIQLGLAITNLIIATREINRLRAAKAALAGQAVATAGAVGVLRTALLTLFGPVGIVLAAATALGSFGLALRNAKQEMEDLGFASDSANKRAEEFLKTMERGAEAGALRIIDELASKISQIEAEIQRLENMTNEELVEAFGGTLNQAIGRMVATQIELGEELERTTANFDALGRRIIDNRKETEEAAEQYKDLEDSVRGAGNEISRYESLLSGLVQRFDPVRAAQNRFSDGVSIINEAIDAGVIGVFEWTEAFTFLQLQLDESLKSLEDAKDGVEELSEAMDAHVQAFERLERGKDIFADFASSLHPAIAELQNFKRELDAIDDAFRSGAITEGQQRFFQTGLAAEFALNSMANMAGRGTKEYKVLSTAAAALNAVLAVQAILQQGAGDPYTAFARMAAMAAVVASLGVQISSSFGGGGGGGAANRQATQGTGTVLGDASAQSESIVNAVQITADATRNLVGINRAMLRALQAMADAIASASRLIAQQGGQFAPVANDRSLGNFISTFGGGASVLGGIIGATDIGAFVDSIFGGIFTSLMAGILGFKTKVKDEGILLVGGTLAELLDETLIFAFQDVKAKWLFGSKNRTLIAELDDAIASQFTLIFEAMVSSVIEAAAILGIAQEEIDRALATFRIEEQRISLLDLTGEEQQQALEAVFSKIFDDLASHVVPFIRDFQQVGEGLGETLVRVATSVLVFEEAVKQLGFSAERISPQQFAEMAVGLVELSGGIEEFISRFTNFVDKFASDEQKMAIVTEAINSAFEQMGLSVPETREALFDLIGTLDASTEAGRQQIAMLLEITDAADAYYKFLEKAEQDRVRAAEEAARALADFESQIFEDLAQHMTPLARETRNLLRSQAEQIARAQELGISEGALAAQRQLHAVQVMALTAQLRASITDLVAAFTGQDNVAEAANDAFFGPSGVVSAVDNGMARIRDSIIRGLEGIEDWLVRSEITNPALTNPQQFAALFERFAQLEAAAFGGDPEAAAAALAEAPQIANELIAVATQLFGTATPEFQAFFADLQDRMREFLGVDVPDVADLQPPTFGQTQSIVQATAELVDRTAEQIRIASQVIEELGALSRLTGESPFTFVEALNVPLREMVEVLVGGLQDVTADTVRGLATIANTMNTSIFELADAIDINIGELTDQTSLVSEAVEGLLGGLPPGIQDKLGPLLEELWHGDDADAAIAELEDAINELDPFFRNLFAPFFDGVESIDAAMDSLATLETIRDIERDQLAELRNISADIRNMVQGEFQTGGFVPSTGLYKLHAGEHVINSVGSNLQVQAANEPGIANELQELKELFIQYGRERIEQGIQQIRSTDGISQTQRDLEREKRSDQRVAA